MLENQTKTQQQFIQEVINDYRVCCISRETSLLARSEVLSKGRAKFGILGDGKEVPQVAMARAFKDGDFRSGYYRDQTFMFALNLATVEEYFAQLYADPENDPFSAGRQMNAHFATPFNDKDGNWLDLKSMKNVSSDISPTGGQMARAVGLSLASKFYRDNPDFQEENKFTNNGNEVCFCTIGDASTSEGVFWESVNAAAVQRIPMAISVWDDGFGISVPIDYQTTKQNISTVLEGFRVDEKEQGMDIYKENAWDYPALIAMYEKGIKKVRETHIPALFHIRECTQPQGHSTSGAHTRYKTKERLEFEVEADCIPRMKSWILEVGLATEEELDNIRKEAKKYVKEQQQIAWNKFSKPIHKELDFVVEAINNLSVDAACAVKTRAISQQLKTLKRSNPYRRDLIQAVKKVIRITGTQAGGVDTLIMWLETMLDQGRDWYTTELYSSNEYSALNVSGIPATYDENAESVQGRLVVNACFDHLFEKYPNTCAFGEDVGYLGDVNKGMDGLQEKYGIRRIFDTGIREWTIMGQAIGMSMRGIRPIAEIQYLDYLLYGLVPLSDDVATLRYRTKGMQQAPVIIRTRGHRLEGIWHTGSPIGMLLGSLRGLYLCVPRNMTQAAGFYNTLIQSNDPAVVIECLNGYRLHEKMPSNITEMCVPLGVPEVLQEGTDITLVTYGSCVRVAEEAVEQLAAANISIELIDAQTLLPFDRYGIISNSLEKTNRLVVLDEDVPGGASAYILQQILEVQKGYRFLDSAPMTIAAAEHRSPYGSDGDYFAKPSADEVYEKLYGMMHEFDPQRFPKLYFM